MVFISFYFVLNIVQMKCVTTQNLSIIQKFNLLIALFVVIFAIWGTAIMFGEKYNSFMSWSDDSDRKPRYRVIFETMVWIRFISLLCCGCMIVMALCIIIPAIATADPTRRQQIFSQMSNAPVVGNLTHAFIDSKTRKFDEGKDGGDATCTICYMDFKDEPERVIAELNCSNKHIFHADCLKQWVERNNTCPLCKEVIPD